MRLRIKYHSWFVPRGRDGWVLYPWMFFRGVPEPDLFRHEMVHVRQIRRDGFIVFYVRYIYYHLRYGYDLNPYEVEANER